MVDLPAPVEIRNGSTNGVVQRRDIPMDAVTDAYRYMARARNLDPTMPLVEFQAWMRGKFHPDMDTDAIARYVCQSSPETLREMIGLSEKPESRSPIQRSQVTVPIDWMAEAPPNQVYLLRHPTKDGKPCPPGQGDGLMRLGKTGALSSAGGVGKTMAIIQLAISVATGLPWMGHFHVGRDVPDKVCLVLGEEDEEDVWRRMFWAVQAMGLPKNSVEEIARNVTVIPLSGQVAPFLQMDRDGEIKRTEHLDALHDMLGQGGPWGLVVIDPQARFAGLEVESNNALATRFVQEVEALSDAPGSPAVLVVSHSSKLARREGGADSRGVTALTDGFRWHGTLANDGPRVKMVVEKNNYGPPSDPVWIDRGDHGVLSVESQAEAEARKADAQKVAKAEAEKRQKEDISERMKRAVEVARNHPQGVTRETLAQLMGGRVSSNRAAIDAAQAKGQLSKTKVPNMRCAVYKIAEIGNGASRL